MTARRDLAASVYAAERSIDAMTKPLGPAVGASVRRHAEDGQITASGRLAILRDVDAALSSVYPAKRGAPSAMQAMIVRRAEEAQRKPIAAAVGQLRDRLDPTLLYLMGGSMIEVTIDREVDAAYLRLHVGEVARTIEVAPGVYVDLDVQGEALGVEIIGHGGATE